ncbi:MAG: Dehydrogenase flavoprotein LodB [Thermomicrobiales bacterium]|nr:Dehydrogenase flavoprotein LodB [Thermomicrobiales bacterium]
MTGSGNTVVVIGGGPAGASTALELARLGIGTVLLEQSDGSGNPVGECLAPSINPLLHRLGVSDVLAASGALPSHGNRSSWGGDGAIGERTFLSEPFGHGWHLDRPAFNATVLDAVEAAGVTIWRQTEAATLERVNGRWEIGTTSSTGPRTLHAGMLVDASGQRAVVARREGVRRRAFDTQIAALAVLDGDGCAAKLHDATTLIAAAEDGWWYAALLPNRRLAVAWFTDPDLLAASAAWRPAGWWDRLRGQNLVWNLISSYGYERPARVQVRAAGSWLLTRLTGNGWIAVGDAAAAFDPLSSHGIGSALAGGVWAARAVAATLAGDDTAFAAYRERILAGYARYLWERQAYYADEQRWPDSPFWRRRHSESSALTEHGTWSSMRSLTGSSRQI